MKTEINTRMVVLEEYDTISKSTFEATAKLLKESMLLHRWLRTNSPFKTGQNEFNTDVTSKLAALSTEDGRLDSDIQALNTDVNSKLSALSTMDERLTRHSGAQSHRRSCRSATNCNFGLDKQDEQVEIR
jgi:hypothetical protein